jgi:hypothetical protein
MRFAVLFVLSLAGLALARPTSGGENSEIKEMMIKAHRGSKSPLGTVTVQLKSEANVDWEVVKRGGEQLQDLSKFLARSKLASNAGKEAGIKKYEQAVLALTEAAVTAHKQLMQSCSGCHYGVPSLKDK